MNVDSEVSDSDKNILVHFTLDLTMMRRTLVRTALVLSPAVLSRAPRRAPSTVSIVNRALDMITKAIDDADISIHIQVLRNVVEFPKTSSIKDEPLVMLTYDGTKGGFAHLTQRAEAMLELRAQGVIESVTKLLRALGCDFDSFFLATVDCIIIQRVGQHVLHINNSTGNSGRALFVELNDVRKGTMTITENLKAKAFKWVLVAVVATFAARVYWYTKTSKDERDRKFEEVKKLLVTNNKGGTGALT